MTDPLRRVAIALFALCGVFSSAAHAHSIDLFAIAAGSEIHGTVTYGDGSPGAGITVEVSWNLSESGDEGDTDSATLLTDDAGKFLFKPTVRGEYLFICRTPDGHRGSYSVPFGLDAEGATAGTLDEQIDASVQRHIGALQEQLHEYERRTRLRDVLGGIGYILGLAGVVALIKTRGHST